MDFESHTFGVKIINGNITVELIESLGEVPKYQFMLSDKIINSYNGNTTYGIDIQQLTTQNHIEFYGWKLISLSFPGNWYGQCGLCQMEDLYGKQKSFLTTNQEWYHIKYKSMIEESIVRAKEFAEKNYSVDYNEIIETKSLFKISTKTSMFGMPAISVNASKLSLLPTGNKISMQGFTELISSTKQYIEDYQKVLATISDKRDERSISLINILKEHSKDIIKEYYSFEIKELSK